MIHTYICVHRIEDDKRVSITGTADLGWVGKMFRKILYPTDFSDCAVKAGEYVKKLKDAGAEEVVVVYVIDMRDLAAMSTGVAGFGETPVTYDYEVQEMMIANVKKKLEELKTEIETVGLKVAVKMPEGVPRKEILKTAEEENVSLIVLGSHGKSNVKELLLGSVSEKVIRNSKRPVLVVKRDEPAQKKTEAL